MIPNLKRTGSNSKFKYDLFPRAMCFCHLNLKVLLSSADKNNAN